MPTAGLVIGSLILYLVSTRKLAKIVHILTTSNEELEKEFSGGGDEDGGASGGGSSGFG